MADSTIWWVGTGAAIAIELLTGTFYLLMLAIGLAAAALAAHAGAGPSIQLVVAAAVGGGAVVGWYQWRKRRGGLAQPALDPNGNLDIGNTVQVDQWNADGTAVVKYRGTEWTAVPRPGQAPASGLHRVVEVVGSRLIVNRV